MLTQITTQPPAGIPSTDPASKAVDGTLTFTNVVNSLQSVYPKQAMNDISTSYCFICVLHLANEKGLVIENQEGFEDLVIRRDFSADLSVGGE
jgi:condensin complex subunit 2